jgi:oligopeptide transport system substrate-binding protein
MTFLDMWTTTSGNNNTNWSNKTYDDLIATAKATDNQAVRMKAMHDAEKIFMDEMPACPIYYYVSVWLENSKLRGTVHDALGFATYQFAYTVR